MISRYSKPCWKEARNNDSDKLLIRFRKKALFLSSGWLSLVQMSADMIWKNKSVDDIRRMQLSHSFFPVTSACSWKKYNNLVFGDGMFLRNDGTNLLLCMMQKYEKYLPWKSRICKVYDRLEAGFGLQSIRAYHSTKPDNAVPHRQLLHHKC